MCSSLVKMPFGLDARFLLHDNPAAAFPTVVDRDMLAN
jgi:hypothetical protein